MRKIIKIYLNIALVILVSSPLSAQAFFLDNLFDDWEKYFEEDSFDSMATSSNVQVINKVNVSASTGGNVAGPGEVIEGQSELKVKIENTINGETIEPVDLEVKSEDEEGAKVDVEQKITYPDEEGKVKVEREIEINEQIETEEYQIEVEDADLSQLESIKQGWGELESSEKPEVISKLTNKISQWWLSFLGGLKETLASMVSFWK